MTKEDNMAKAKGNTGLNINSKKVEIQGDAIGGDKNVYSANNPNPYAQAASLMSEVKAQINLLEQVDRQRKDELTKMAQQIEEHLQSQKPQPKTIIDDIENFQKFLATVGGIGTAGIGIYTIIENIIKLISK